jgi:hypothetical protein
VSEDAVSPVVATMLILAIVVTFFTAWNTLYVPSMKAQSEITHIKEVESGFLRFSSDIETAASLKKNMRMSEPIPLGGGEFTFDTVKSGGLLRVQNETEGYLRLTITKITPADTARTILRLSRFTYQPVNNFWQDQGYTWSYGNVNITKGTLSTPLQYTNMDEVSYGVTGSLFDLDSAQSLANPAACTVINVYTVNISPAAGHTLANGNGNGMLVLESTIMNQQFANATSMTVRINPDIPEGFRDAIWDSVNQSIDKSRSCANVHTYPDPSNLEVLVVFDSIPNMTLNRKTTEISLGAY